eukprot:1786338-Alexandrium_andersonii.AAC.1
MWDRGPAKPPLHLLRQPFFKPCTGPHITLTITSLLLALLAYGVAPPRGVALILALGGVCLIGAAVRDVHLQAVAAAVVLAALDAHLHAVAVVIVPNTSISRSPPMAELGAFGRSPKASNFA